MAHVATLTSHNEEKKCRSAVTASIPFLLFFFNRHACTVLSARSVQPRDDRDGTIAENQAASEHKGLRIRKLDPML